MVICDVGQGDGIYIRTPKGIDIVIDGGPDEKILACLSSHMPFWDRTIEIMFLTHPHADHYTGLISVLERYTVLQFDTQRIGAQDSAYLYLEQLLEKNHIPRRYHTTGAHYRLADGVHLSTLWPSAAIAQAQDRIERGETLDVNGVSLVQVLLYGECRMLFTGDAEGELYTALSSRIGTIDVLKVAHHGSKDGMPTDALQVVQPKVAVISVGEKNRYHHSATETLELLSREEIQVLRTDEQKTIEIVSDGKTWFVQ